MVKRYIEERKRRGGRGEVRDEKGRKD